ncbi:MAG TPA: alpha/beta fold hydrolase [Oculatellaceae cyanobacterium]|jgi:pimeloyl-ACP methyl ester carboxylesterase
MMIARFFLATLLVALMLSQAACVPKLPPMPWDKKPVAHEQAADAEENAEGEEASAEEELDMTRLIPEAMRKIPYVEVTVPMPDGLQMSGRLYNPALTLDADGETVAPIDLDEEYKGPKYPLVILLHGLNYSQSHWHTLPRTLMEAGYAVLTLDLRGHGASTQTLRGRAINWRTLPDGDWSIMYRDVARVVEYFKKSEDYPEVDARRVAVIGEKLGANVAIWAAKQKKEIQALVLLTPSMTFKGMDAGKGLVNYVNSVMILASQDEPESYAAARYLYGWLEGPKVLQVYQKAGEGADMLSIQPAIGLQIRDWLVKTYPPAKAPKSAQ